MVWQNFLMGGAGIGAFGLGGFVLLFALLAVWSIIWKGMALWKAAHEESKVWFVIMLVVNTMGILEILYIYVFSKKSNKPVSASNQSQNQA